jgi:phage terminase small subunit
MAAHAKDREAHLADKTWRADRHADRVDAGGVPGVEADSSVWNLIAQWQQRFDAAMAEVERDGATITNAGDQLVPHPSHKVAKEASSELRALFAIVGVGPLNRARLGKGAVDDDAGASDGLPPAAVRHG